MITGSGGGIVGNVSDVTYLSGQEAHDQGYINIISAGNGRGGLPCKVYMSGYIGRNQMEIRRSDVGNTLVWHDIEQGEGYASHATNEMYLPLLENNGTISQIPSSWTKSALYFKPNIKDVQVLDGQFIGLVSAVLRGLYVVWYEGDYVEGNVHEAPASQMLRMVEDGECYYWFRHWDSLDVLQPIIYSLASVNIADTAHAGASGYDPETGKWLFTTYSRLNLQFSGIRVFSSYNDIIQYFGTPDDEPEEEDDNLDELKSSVNIDNDLSSVLRLGKSAFDNFAHVLYPATQSQMDDVLDGLAMYGENPVNFIVNAFYLPFNPEDFIDDELPHQDDTLTTTNFGRYTAEIGGHHRVLSLKPKTIGSMEITGNYNDFRDYTTKNLYLLLPYCGIQQLNTEKYIYKTLTLKAFFDIRTGIIKYYVYAGDSIMDMFQGSIKSDMPVAGSNRSESMKNIISSAGQFFAGGARVASGDLTGLGDMLGGLYGTGKAAPKSVSGSFSAETNLMDFKDCKLIIEDVECWYPANIVANYGRPDNRVGNIGSNTGYVQVDNVQLHSTQTLSRQEEIIRLLKEGVII